MSTSNRRHNDDDRHTFAINDEGLYDLMRASGLTEMAWVRKNRALIDEVMHAVVTGQQHQHYLKYGDRR